MDGYWDMSKKGFTIVEVLIAMFVGALIMTAVYGLMVMAQKTSSSLDRRVITQQDTRAVLNLMATEIRMASYNPLNQALIWAGNGTAAMPGITACWGVNPVVNANKGIQIANATTLAFAMDIDADGAFASNNEYIMYAYDGNSTLSRSTNCGTPQHILGGNAPLSNIRNAAAGVTMFRYFGTAGELTVPVNIPDIRSVLITIVSETEHKDLSSGQPKRMVYSTTVIVRNHVLSPPYALP